VSLDRTICWFSAGAASAVATKLTLKEVRAEVVYCDTGSEHPDNERFIADCEKWFGQSIVRIKSEKYSSTWDVWEKRRYLAGVDGALCTTELKKIPRFAYQRPFDEHVFGYTADKRDLTRFINFKNNFPELTVYAPLIERGLDKANCLAVVQSAGIVLPVVYGLGFQNNNCLPCSKATSPDYWSLVRMHFPEKFERMAKLSRELNVRLCRIKNERRFIDEIPADWPTTNPIAPACDFMCQVASDDDLAEAVPLFASAFKTGAAA
jgi:3'-phosphoadenosine 5'-phosphosulfate sulfotransferase (PAPS reductase)/FAD synthetase